MRLATILATCLTVACVSAGPIPGSGDIAFRLEWSGPADLDLLVQGPDDQILSFIHRTSDAGGILDIDCNAFADRLCRRPIENVYWPSGHAPLGRYKYWVDFLQTHQEADEARFTLQVLLGQTVVVSKTGTLSLGSTAGPFEYIYAPGS